MRGPTRSVVGFGVGLLLASAGASAHEFAPAVLELAEAPDQPGSVDVTWTVPIDEDGQARLKPVLSCAPAGPVSTQHGERATVLRWKVQCPPALVGARIEVQGLREARSEAVVRIPRPEGGDLLVLRADTPVHVVASAPRAAETFLAMLRSGVEHILLGVDHLLFVLGLLLLTRTFRQLLWTLSAFTLAHSLTLSLSVLGVVRLDQAPVEAVIALSIALLSFELLRSPDAPRTLTHRFPGMVAFAFGLLHGFGFAGALRESGIPPNHVPLTLLAFNLGVELGQIAFVVPIGAVLAQLARWPRWHGRLLRGAAYAMGVVAVCWFLERATQL